MELWQSIIVAFLSALLLGMPLWFALVEKIPRSHRKVDNENEELRKQHDEDCKKIQEMERYKTEGERLYNTAREKLQKTFSEDVPKMLDSVITGRLNNAFDSDLSLQNFHAKIYSPDSNKTYTVTLKGCNCPDYIGDPSHIKKNPLPCKHMLYLAYTLGILQVNEEETKEKYWISVQRINENAEKIKEQEKQIKKNQNTIKRQEQKIAKQKAADKAAAKNQSLKN